MEEILELLENYRVFLSQQKRLLGILAKNPGDSDTLDLINDLYESTVTEIQHLLPDDLSDEDSIEELIAVFLREEAATLEEAIEICRTEKLP